MARIGRSLPNQGRRLRPPADTLTSTSVLIGGQRVNLHPNPSIETATTGYHNSGAGTTSALTAVGDAIIGSNVIRATLAAVSGAGLSYGDTTTFIQVTGGATYTWSFYARVPSTSPAAWANPFPQLIWKTDSSGAINVSAVSGATISSIPVSNTWQRVTVTATAPVNARAVYLSFASATVPTAGTLVDLDGMLFEQSGFADAYFDGSVTGGAWVGTANLSASTITPAASALLPTFPVIPSTAVVTGQGAALLVPTVPIMFSDQPNTTVTGQGAVSLDPSTSLAFSREPVATVTAISSGVAVSLTPTVPIAYSGQSTSVVTAVGVTSLTPTVPIKGGTNVTVTVTGQAVVTLTATIPIAYAGPSTSTVTAVASVTLTPTSPISRQGVLTVTVTGQGAATLNATVPLMFTGSRTSIVTAIATGTTVGRMIAASMIAAAINAANGSSPTMNPATGQSAGMGGSTSSTSRMTPVVTTPATMTGQTP